MAKRRSSISGRGAEILLGEPPPIEVEPRGPDPALMEAEHESPEPVADPLAALPEKPLPPPDPEPLFDEADLERALFEEARAGEPGPEGEEADLSMLEEEPPTPEMELAFIEEAVAAEEPPEPIAEAPAPTLEVTMEEQELQEATAIHQPPPSETGEFVEDILPPRLPRGFIDLGEAGSVVADVQMGGAVEQLELPELVLSEEEKKELLRRWGGARLQELDDEISRTYDQVLSRVGENEDIATECYNKLLKSRDIVLRRDASRIPQAEYYVAQVQARLKRATDSEKGASKWAWWITGWGFLWGLVFLVGLVAPNIFDLPLGSDSLLDLPVEIDVVTFLSAMIWGGLGGVVAVWYSLFKHVGRRDFDTQYNLSYVGKPFLGLVLGATVYMLFHLLMTLRILPIGLQTDDGTTLSSVTPWIIYPVSWACGFKENRIFDLVDRVMKRIFSGKEVEEPIEPEELTPPTE
jgi:hypothetical protein